MGLSALLVSTTWAMPEPLLRGTSDRTGSTFSICVYQYLFNYFPYWSLWVNFHAYEKDTYINRKESGHYLLGSVKFLALRSMG